MGLRASAIYFSGKICSYLPLSLLMALARLAAYFLGTPYKWWLGRIERQISNFKKQSISLDKFEVIDRHYFEGAKKEKRGIIFVSVHQFYSRLFFNWLHQTDEASRPYLIKDLSTIHRDRLTLHVHEIHMKIFSGRILQEGGDMRQAVRILQQGGCVVLFQDLVRENAPIIQFLGKACRNPLGAVKLAKLTNAVILPFSTAKKKKWEIRFFAPVVPSKENLAALLEQIILADPEAWENRI